MVRHLQTMRICSDELSKAIFTLLPGLPRRKLAKSEKDSLIGLKSAATRIFFNPFVSRHGVLISVSENTGGSKFFSRVTMANVLGWVWKGYKTIKLDLNLWRLHL